VNRVLFLDIDGVLNSAQWGDFDNFDPDNVAQLRRIVLETRCAMVLSSSWRYYHALWEIEARLAHAGFEGAKIVDQTPVLDVRKYPYATSVKFKKPYTPRGHEVDAWVQLNNFTGTYVCLDDHDDFGPHNNLVQTDEGYGLTAADADKVIRLFNV